VNQPNGWFTRQTCMAHGGFAWHTSTSSGSYADRAAAA
jgi:hypothetical protein